MYPEHPETWSNSHVDPRTVRNCEKRVRSADRDYESRSLAPRQWPGLARAARVAQDERRQTAQSSELMERAAQRVEVETAPVEPYLGDVYERFPRLRPEAGPSFDGLLARPPPSSASDTPNADQLALQQAMLDYNPPPLPHDGPPPPLMNNPQGGGGQHNPVELEDAEEEN